jgi:hypothetical protein
MTITWVKLSAMNLAIKASPQVGNDIRDKKKMMILTPGRRFKHSSAFLGDRERISTESAR